MLSKNRKKQKTKTYFQEHVLVCSGCFMLKDERLLLVELWFGMALMPLEKVLVDSFDGVTDCSGHKSTNSCFTKTCPFGAIKHLTKKPLTSRAKV